MRRVGWWVGLVGLQAALVGAYWLVEGSRQSEAPFLSESLDVAAPAVSFDRGGRVDLPAGRTVVHFWATWCAPCQTELPALLTAAEAGDVHLIAATDEPWPVIERYFDGDVPMAIVRDPEGVARAAYAVSGLPDTFVVENGRVVARVGGPRDWSVPSARRFLNGGG